MPKPSDQLNTKDWGLWLKPRKEDLVCGSQHINTRVESSTSSGYNNVTLIRFTAEVTMGAALYAEWAKGGKFNMPALSQLAEMAHDQEALPHTTKFLNPGDESVDVAGGKTNMPFAVYLINDSVNTFDHVSKTLEKVCSLPVAEAKQQCCWLTIRGRQSSLRQELETKHWRFRPSFSRLALQVKSKVWRANWHSAS